MASNGISMTEILDEAMESAVQDQTAIMCRMILPYTFRQINANGSVRLNVNSPLADLPLTLYDTITNLTDSDWGSTNIGWIEV